MRGEEGPDDVYASSRDRGRGAGRKRKGKKRRKGERWLRRETDKRRQKDLSVRSYPNLDSQKDAIHLLGWPHCCYGNTSKA